MASGEVGSTAAFVFSETYRPVPVDCRHMSVECPFGSDMDVKAVPSCDFKKHFCRYFLTVLVDAIGILSPFFPVLLFFSVPDAFLPAFLHTSHGPVPREWSQDRGH